LEIGLEVFEREWGGGAKNSEIQSELSNPGLAYGGEDYQYG